MRGTPCLLRLLIATTGIIPAYAGNTAGGFAAVQAGQGSSPHMRGTQNPRAVIVNALGIIPAYAGNTGSRSTMPPTFWDHPRICGEHHPRASHAKSFVGSSPHMRGTRYPSRSCDCACGIIPAYAGNTQVHMAWRVPLRDHPRICGEHPPPLAVPKNAMGSSPHMRGTLDRQRAERVA